MNYPKVILEIAAAVGLKPHRDKYRMWHQVIYIGETAMVFDEVVMGGGYAICPLDERPASFKIGYVIEAIKNHAFSLGEYSRGSFIPWNQRIGKYPPGYFTHQVGIGVSGL